MFAKLFDTSLGQVAVLRQSNDDNEPEIRFYFEPNGMGVSSMEFGYSDNDDGWEAQKNGFEMITLMMAEAAAKQISEFSL